jgi:hypothetical protein
MWERKNWTPAKTGMDLYRLNKKRTGNCRAVRKDRKQMEKITGERKCESDAVHHLGRLGP